MKYIPFSKEGCLGVLVGFAIPYFFKVLLFGENILGLLFYITMAVAISIAYGGMVAKPQIKKKFDKIRFR